MHRRASRTYVIAALVVSTLPALAVAKGNTPAPPGKLVDLGGHQLHVHCSGTGAPAVIVENGLGDFSFDWTLVQNRSPVLRASAPTIAQGTRGAIRGQSLGRLPS